MISPRILIVDDDHAQLVLYRLMLRRLPYSIMTTSNAEEALQIIYATPPVLILLDVMLPQVNGLVLLQALRADQALLNIKIVLLTVIGDRLNSADTALANAVFTKPIQRNVLEEEITHLL